jgi:hypothetical protein
MVDEVVFNTEASWVELDDHTQGGNPVHALVENDPGVLGWFKNRL